MTVDAPDPSASLVALGPLDGRYARQTAPLRAVFSEAGLIHRRVRVEIAWLRALCDEPGIPEARALSADEAAALQRIADGFSVDDAAAVKAIEATTNHDVKAVEYFLRQKLAATSMADLAPLLHFACTSEDINNVSHSLQLKDGLAILRPAQEEVTEALAALARDTAALPMLARTHGQAASPTTLGKEIAVAVSRLRRQAAQLDALRWTAKMSGAVGNYNAHVVACPEVDWPAFSRRVLASFGLEQNPLTTQIEPHDGIAELCDALARWNTVLLDFDRDAWSYISLGYLRQRPVAGEVGSSTMPHKVNPIDFENSEGNAGIANALLGHLARKLPVSRMQRDLTDSTVLRSLGTAFGHCLLACTACRKGLGKIRPDAERLAADLDAAWEVLAEPVQTVLRRYGAADAYERLKELTRGKRIDAAAIRDFIAAQPIPQEARDRLAALTPATYTGLAEALAKEL
ncbi:MAG: adenylosuccinate lyase [Kiritimatiellia bacterium]|jgi:adenylosuccinate lyase